MKEGRDLQGATGRARIRGQVLWGLIDQGCSSATSFGLTLVGARLLGPSGVGVIYLGFTVYLLVLALQRALINDPLVVVSASLPPTERRQATRRAVTATITLGTGATFLTAAAGLVFPAGLGQGLVLFAPWILPTLLHELFRTALFRDERGAAAARNTTAWLACMAIIVAVTWKNWSSWTVVASWGLGAGVGAALGLASTQAWPERPTSAWLWWRRRAWPLGRWLAVESAVLSARLQLTILLLAGVLGTSELGGLRAAQSLFAFMTLVGPAVAMAGLPLITRALETSTAAAYAAATRISVIALAIVAAYLAVVGTLRNEAMEFVFTRDFVAFAYLVLPLGLAQLLAGVDVGFALFLKACSEGRKLLWGQLAYSAATFALSLSLAVRYGVEGAAWGFVLASLLGASLMVWFARRVATARGLAAAEASSATPAMFDLAEASSERRGDGAGLRRRAGSIRLGRGG